MKSKDFYKKYWQREVRAVPESDTTIEWTPSDINIS